MVYEKISLNNVKDNNNIIATTTVNRIDKTGDSNENPCLDAPINNKCVYYEEGNVKLSLVRIKRDENRLNHYKLYINDNYIMNLFDGQNLDNNGIVIEVLEDNYVILETGLVFPILSVYSISGENIIDFKDNLEIDAVKYDNKKLYTTSLIGQEGFPIEKDKVCELKDYFDYYEIKRELTYDEETKTFREPIIISTIKLDDYVLEQFDSMCD